MRLILCFLIGLLAVFATVAIIKIAILSFKWLSDFIKKRLQGKEEHKVVFADTREVVGEYLSKRVENSEGISMEDLEKMCSTTPYVAADIDENGNITNYEGIDPAETDNRVWARMKQQDGMIIVEG